MANRIPKLTKRAVEAIKTNGADTVYWDGELTGFGIRVRKSGRKNYILQTRVRGKLRWFTIGQHGRITPDEARTAALEILAQTKIGIDPRDADAKCKAEPLMAELGRRFLEEYVPTHCKPRTQGEYRRSVTLFIDPAIGEVRISEVERKDIAKIPWALEEAGRSGFVLAFPRRKRRREQCPEKCLAARIQPRRPMRRLIPSTLGWKSAACPGWLPCIARTVEARSASTAV